MAQLSRCSLPAASGLYGLTCIPRLRGRTAPDFAPFHVCALAFAAILAFSAAASAAAVNIVALGASNTYGAGRGRTAGGVSPSEAYPAQLEALLRAHAGVDAHVTNAGVAGDTTAGMFARYACIGRAEPDAKRHPAGGRQ